MWKITAIWKLGSTPHFLLPVQIKFSCGCNFHAYLNISLTAFFFFSYHQKYLLRQQPTLLRSLGLNSVELLNSSVAARLNGYVGGYGALKDFEAEVDELKISEAQADMVRKIISNKRF